LLKDLNTEVTERLRDLCVKSLNVSLRFGTLLTASQKQWGISCAHRPYNFFQSCGLDWVEL